MIEVNLRPGTGKKKKAAAAAPGPSVKLGSLTSGFTGRLRDKFMIFALAALAASGAAIGLLFTTQSAKEYLLTNRRDAALRDSTRYANVLKERYRAEAVRDSLLRQVNLIQHLDEDRYVWPHVLDEVSRALPQYTWLTSITFNGTPQGSVNVVLAPKNADTSAAAKKANAGRPPKRLETTIPKDVITLRLMGHTADIQAVTRFMRDLEASPYFANVVLEKSEPVIDQGKEIAAFQLTVGYTRPDTLMLRRVPLSLSVK
jgi:Tfp pilus assembly protein PilN